MRTFLLSVLLVACVLPSVHAEQEMQPKDQGRNGNEQSVKKTEVPTPSIIVSNCTHPEKASSQAEKQTSKTESYQWTPYLTNGELVLSVITLVYVFISYFILRATSKQADLAKISAEAARLNAQAVINAERPWIVISAHPNPEVPGQFLFTAANKGRTPAEFISGDAVYRFVPDPMQPPPPPPLFPAPFNKPNETLIVQGDHFEIYPSGVMPEPMVVGNRDMKNFDSRPLFLVFYGRIGYADVFDPKTMHETYWCFGYLFQERRFVATGPEGYNKHT